MMIMEMLENANISRACFERLENTKSKWVWKGLEKGQISRMASEALRNANISNRCFRVLKNPNISK